MPELAAPRSATWKWSVCGVLLLATMLNYMDRQTLSQTAADLTAELKINNDQYGNLEFAFGIAFALGGLVTGLLVDRIPVRWMYPGVVLGWSLAGFATAYAAPVGRWLGGVWEGVTGAPVAFDGLEPEAAQTYLGLLVCQSVLGIFEAGQWPCALVTTQRLLTQKDRTFGNSLLQSGASIGAIVTPLIVQSLVTDDAGSWRAPFAVIGAIGILWLIPWFALIRSQDLARPAADSPAPGAAPVHGAPWGTFARRFAVLVCVVVAINLTWHYFRAWMPKYLREFLHYERDEVNYFTSAYYIATDVGCLAVGFATRWLAGRGWSVHGTRLATFGGCACLTALSVVAAQLPQGLLLQAVLLAIGFGSLGLFPVYYSLSQELSVRNQGAITGTLSAITWLATSAMHKRAGQVIDATQSHTAIMTTVGILPLAACVILALGWGKEAGSSESPTGQM
ncbi:MAG: MFS transporter [Planctomycetales bacterium]